MYVLRAAHPFALWALHAVLALAPVRVRGVSLVRAPDPDADYDALTEATEVGSEGQEQVDLSRESWLEEDIYHLRALPNVSFFQEKWRKFMNNDVELNALTGFKKMKGLLEEPPDTYLRMVIGVFTTLDSTSAPYRDAIRRTWFKQKLVCPVEDVFKLETPCKIFVTFVAGRNSSAGFEGTNETDVTVLPIEENMNCGKTRHWFEYAANKYRQSTHIGKMDMDAFLHVQKLVDIMQRFPTLNTCKQHFGGRSWHCHTPEYCPPEDCWFPTGTDFFKYPIDNPDCWSYMQGGFYFLSRDVVAHIAVTDGWWHRQQGKHCYPEDALAGKAVMNYAKARKICVGAVNLRDTGAYWHPDHYEYWFANDGPIGPKPKQPHRGPQHAARARAKYPIPKPKHWIPKPKHWQSHATKRSER